MQNNLLLLNRRGLIPGPTEPEEDFLLRAQFNPSIAPQSHQGAFQRTLEIFNRQPDWVDVITHSQGLRFWEGAATWIEQGREGTRHCRIQIKDSFPSRLYPKEEVVAHEMVHAMRVMFDESRFEEILAWKTSKNFLRRYCGPLFSGSKEAGAFLISFLVPWIAWWVAYFSAMDSPDFLFFIPCAVLGWGIFRLVRSQRIFAAALRNLEKAVSRKEDALAAALSLTDAEIELFATISPEEIRSFACQKKEIRWRQIELVYFR